MKKIIYLLVILITLFCESCINTLQPLVTADKIVTDERIGGTWNSREGDMLIEPVPVSRIYREMEVRGDKGDSALVSKMYMLSYRKNGVDYNMFASLILIGEHLFMDLRPVAMTDPARPENNGFDFISDYLSGYTIAKVEWKNDRQMVVRFADGDFVRQQLVNGRLRLKYEYDELFGTCLISASSKELQQFVQKYATDERLFSSRNSVTLTRKG
jgi:hypothetical protein